MADQKKSVDEDPKTEAIRQYLDGKDAQKFIKDHGASGFGIGQGGNGEPCLNLYFDARRPGVKRAGPPKSVQIPHGGRTFDVEIREIPVGDFRLDAGTPQGPPLHVAGGAGISADQAGTLGGWAWEPARHRLVFLSNHHVLKGARGVPVFCPAREKADVPVHQLGKTIMGRRYLDGKAKVDCAMGSIDHPERADLEVSGLGPAIMDIGKVRPNAPVVKFGHGTKRTEGTICDQYYTNNIPVDFLGKYPVADCFLIKPSDPSGHWAQAGDSGALVLSKEPNARGVREVIGLHFAVISLGDGERGVACKIENVFRALSITTLPEGILAATVAAAVGVHEEADDMMKVLHEFRDCCTTSDAGKRVLDVIEENRTGLVSLLATSDELRAECAATLRSVFAVAEGVADVMDRPLEWAIIERIRAFGAGLADAAANLQEKLDLREDGRPDGRDLHAAVQACLNDLPQAPGYKTLDAIIQPQALVPAGAHAN